MKAAPASRVDNGSGSPLPARWFASPPFSFDEVMRPRTTLFIAHRLTTAARADRILVMAHGEVIETGSHAELLALGKAYAGLFAAFSGGVL